MKPVDSKALALIFFKVKLLNMEQEFFTIST